MKNLLTKAEQHLRQAVKRDADGDARGAIRETRTVLRLLSWAHDRCANNEARRMILEANWRVTILQGCLGRKDHSRIIQTAIKADFYIRHAATKADQTLDLPFAAAVREIYGQVAG